MKKLYIALSLFLASFAYSQVPQAFSYQTIAFNSAGAPITNGNINLRISILDNSATGTVLYTETHTKTTNSKGLVNLNIGQGTATTGNFGGINWGTNTKFVKVELDPAGGNNYTNVGVNQLMTVPYAQVSKTVVTGAGQGITLVSPNGTNYTLNVDNSGNLNLPVASSSNASFPADLYMYGSYNSFNATSSEHFRNSGSQKMGYKYLPTNTQIKFIAAPNSSAQVYGSNNDGKLVLNGSNFTVNSNGFYEFYLTNYGTEVFVSISNIDPTIDGLNNAIAVSKSYNTATSKFTFILSGVTSSNFSSSGFQIKLGYNGQYLGDNLADGNFDMNGSGIKLPNLTTSPKNFKIEFSINVDGTGTYTITQI